MSYVSDTIRCAEYLFEKNSHLLDAPTNVGLLGNVEQRQPYTAEEHDELYRIIRDSQMNNTQLSKKLGVPRTTVSQIRRKVHPQYHPERSEK